MQTIPDIAPPAAIPNLSPKELWELTTGICDGSVFTSHQIRETNMIPMIFMPVVFNALGPEQIDHPKPAPPTKPEIHYMDEPDPTEGFDERLKAHETQLEALREAVQRAEWSFVAEDVTRAHQALIDHRDPPLDEAYKLALQTWHAECGALRKEHKVALKAHQAALKAFEVELALWDEIEVLREAQRATWSAAYDIGFIWEYMLKAGPTSVNGYPIFTSLSIVNKADAKKIFDEVIKEQARREANPFLTEPA